MDDLQIESRQIIIIVPSHPSWKSELHVPTRQVSGGKLKLTPIEVLYRLHVSAQG